MQIVGDAIDEGAHLRIVVFGGAASNAVLLFDRDLEVVGPNASYVTAAKRRVSSQVRLLVTEALLRRKKVPGPKIAGSDPFGALRYGVIAAGAGQGRETRGALWVLTDGAQAWRRTNLVRLLRNQTPQEVIRRWLKPYITDARGVAVHVHGLNQSNPPTIDIRVATRVETTYRLFCRRLRARSCDITGEV
jgi:hypothetical protein